MDERVLGVGHGKSFGLGEHVNFFGGGVIGGVVADGGAGCDGEGHIVYSNFIYYSELKSCK
jgi:hypothetical protein